MLIVALWKAILMVLSRSIIHTTKYSFEYLQVSSDKSHLDF